MEEAFELSVEELEALCTFLDNLCAGYTHMEDFQIKQHHFKPSPKENLELVAKILRVNPFQGIEVFKMCRVI